MKLLIDTGAYSAFARGHAETRDRVASARELVLSAVVLGELYHGFRFGSRFEENCRQIEQFRREPRVTTVGIGPDTAFRFGAIMADLRRIGRPIPTNDVWIAAQALEVGAVVLTFDSDFEHVPGLLVHRVRANTGS